MEGTHRRRGVLIAVMLAVLVPALLAAGPTAPVGAQEPEPDPVTGLLPGEEDGSDTEHEDTEHEHIADAAPTTAESAVPGARAVEPVAPLPCPRVPFIVAPGPDGPQPPGCPPCPSPRPPTIAPAGAAPSVVPPPGVPCIDPSIRAVQRAVNLANQVQAESLRTLETSGLQRAFVEPAYGEMAGFVDYLWWSGRYAEARLLGVRHLDTTINRATARTRSLERWDYREYDLDSGRLVYSSYQIVENRWTLVRIGTRWYVSRVEIVPR